jgi:uncharacterized paraquat-inducible protein A
MFDRLVFYCPHCEAKLEAPYRLAGSTDSCPQCKGTVMVRVPVPSDADIMLVDALEGVGEARA